MSRTREVGGRSDEKVRKLTITGLVSDLDGTLINSKPTLKDAWYEAFTRNGVNCSFEEVSEAIEKSMKTSPMVRKFIPDADDQLIKTLEELRGDVFIEMIGEKDIVFPGAKDFLVQCRDMGVKIAIATGMSGTLLLRTIERTGLKDLVDVVVSSENGTVIRGGVIVGETEKKGSKDKEDKDERDKKDTIIEAFTEIGVNPIRGAVVGDSESDVIPGREIGARTIFISPKGNQRIADAVVLGIADTMSALLSLEQKSGDIK